VEGDKIAWVRTHIGTHQKEFFGVPATGKKVVWKSCVISRVVDDKIVEEWHTTNPREQLK
jgi:predicted ester cyclase